MEEEGRDHRARLCSNICKRDTAGCFVNETSGRVPVVCSDRTFCFKQKVKLIISEHAPHVFHRCCVVIKSDGFQLTC